MKKSILFILITLHSFSQTKFGVKGGLNLADVSQSLTVSGQIITDYVTIGNGNSTTQTTTEYFSQTAEARTTPIISFYVGGYMESAINKKKNLFLRLELLYSQNGTNIDAKTNDTSFDSGILNYYSNGGKYIVNQLDIPVLLKFVTNKKIAFIGGFYFGRILSAKAINNNGISQEISSAFKKYDLGLSIGADYPVTKNINIELRYNRGLLNLDPYKVSNQYFELAGQFYNRSVHLGMTYQFN